MGPRLDVTAARGDDPGRHRTAEPERIADRHHPIANLGGAAVAESNIGQRLIGLDFQNREVGLRVAADDLGRIFGLVLKNDLDLCGIANHVVVGHDVAGRIDDKAEPSAIRWGSPPGICGKDWSAARVLLIEKPSQHLVERRIGKALERGTLTLVLLIGHLIRAGLLCDRDVDDGRQHLFDQRGEALLLDQGHRRCHRLRRRGGRCRRIFGPHHGRQRDVAPSPTAIAAARPRVNCGSAGFASGRTCHLIPLVESGCSRRPQERKMQTRIAIDLRPTM